MKIAHLGDVHWGLGYPGPSPESRFEDINRVMDWVASQIIKERCDLALFTGDAFKDARVFLDRASVEIKAFAGWLRKIAAVGIPVIVISGTPSHDAVAAYKLIQEMQIPGVTIIIAPEVIRVKGVSIACLPGMNRSSLVTQDEYRSLPPHVIHQLMTNKITETCQEMLAQSGPPAVLLAHLTYDLADKGFEDVLLQHEPALTNVAIRGFNLVCLGHIHRPQQNGDVFYCGSPERLSFNDEQITPGFWIHDLDLGLPYDNVRSMFIETPARRFKTISLDEVDLEWIMNGGSAVAPLSVYDDLGDAIVRIRYACSEEMAKRLDRKVLEKAIYNDLGVFFIHEIKADVQRQDRARDEDVTEAMGPVEALARWAQQQEVADAEIAILQSMTSKLLEEVAS